MKKKDTGLIILKIAYCVVVFVCSLFFFSMIFNRGNSNMTSEMTAPTLPTVYFSYNGYRMNLMYGFTTDMDETHIRDSITPLMPGRKMSINIDTYGSSVSKICYEIRTIDAQRLIEDTTVYNYLQEGDIITADIQLKDLIEENQEYLFNIKLELSDGRTVKYYTRIIENEDLNTASKLEFVYNFTKTTFDEVEAKNQLPTYLESNSDGDNSTLHHVDIHSSLSQVTWGKLNTEMVDVPYATIKEIKKDSAVICVEYFVSVQNESGGEDEIITEYYTVKDTYRIKEGKDRMLLYEYFRDMNRVFSLSSGVITKNKIMLGITDEDVSIVENSDGSRFAFVNAGRLYTYSFADNKMANIFGFYDDGEECDLRLSGSDNDIRIYNIDDAGNMYFVVYGYMPRGINEGKMGMALYYYDSIKNVVEEKVFVEYDDSFERLEKDLDILCYVSEAGDFYVYMDESILYFSKDNYEPKIIVEKIPLGGLVVSKDYSQAAWISGTDYYNASQVVWKNLDSGNETYVEAEEGIRIIPIGFFGNNLIYGRAEKDMIGSKKNGETLFPMENIIIRDESGNILKEYNETNIYVTGVTVYSDMISMERMILNDDGTLGEYTADQILDNSETASGKNVVETVITENYETIVQIVAKNELHMESIQILTPKQVKFEDDRTVETMTVGCDDYFYVYAQGGLFDICAEESDAVKEAGENAGVVTDSIGVEIFAYDNNTSKSTISEITIDESVDMELSESTCVDLILAYNGITYSSEEDLNNGLSSEEILSTNLTTGEILNLRGVDSELIKYYISRKIPVLTYFGDEKAVIVVGYTDYNFVICDPISGSVYSVDDTDFDKKVAEGGYRFITYI